jgi:hypothetical protein
LVGRAVTVSREILLPAERPLQTSFPQGIYLKILIFLVGLVNVKGSGHPRDILWTLIQDAETSQEKLPKFSSAKRPSKSGVANKMSWVRYIINGLILHDIQ